MILYNNDISYLCIAVVYSLYRFILMIYDIVIIFLLEQILRQLHAAVRMLLPQLLYNLRSAKLIYLHQEEGRGARRLFQVEANELPMETFLLVRSRDPVK